MRDRLKDLIARRVFHPAQGMTSAVWWSLLGRHRFAVDPSSWPRASIQTALCAANSINARLEHQIYGRRINETAVRAPLFILGHYRSGTTHLHNLLALDPQLAAATLFQVLNPHTFLLSERWGAPVADKLMVRHRFQDEVALGAGVPSEDEFALGTMTGLSPYLGWNFPRDAGAYDRCLTFRDVPDAEVARWGRAFTTLLKKLTLRHGRPLVLKSPPHTARIRLILDLFPDARFVHIHRHPHEVFRSTRHMIRTVQPVLQFQRCSPLDSDDTILRVYAEMYAAYFEQRHLITQGRLCDVAFADIQRDPLGVVGSVYQALDLTGFETLQPRLKTYLGGIAGYRKNQYADLPGPLRARIGVEWSRSFSEWGYDR